MLDRFGMFVAGVTSCYRSIQKIKSMEMTEFGLKGTHVMCLFYLQQNREGLTAAQLCQLCCEDKAAVSRNLWELEQKGYIQTQTDSGKKYRARIFLTESGEAVVRQMDDLIRQWVTLGGSGLSEQERNDFYRTLGLIADNLKKNLPNG